MLTVTHRSVRLVAAIGVVIVLAFVSLLGFEIDSIGWRESLEQNINYVSRGDGTTKLLVTVQLASIKAWHFENFFFESWELVVANNPAMECDRVNRGNRARHKDRKDGAKRQKVQIVDLLIACEPDSCKSVPLRCQHWDENTPFRRQGDVSQCFYLEYYDPTIKYRFAHSINYLASSAFNSFVKKGEYDYVMRTDADTVLFPGIRYFVPRGDGIFGAGFSGTEFTFEALHYVAENTLGINGLELRIKSLQSTFTLRASVFKAYAEKLVALTETLNENAFSKKVCNEITLLPIVSKQNISTAKSLCRWPYWHQGVSTLYATALAANVVLDEPALTGRLDLLATPRTELHAVSKNAATTIQAHLLMDKHAFNVMLHNMTHLCKDSAQVAKDLKLSGNSRIKFLDSLIEFGSPEPPHCDMAPRRYIGNIINSNIERHCNAFDK